MVKRGRPSKISRALISRICERLVNGESLIAICASDKFPAKKNVLHWLNDGESFASEKLEDLTPEQRLKVEFRNQYAHARQMQMELMADDILTIADDGHNDWMQKFYRDDSVWVENGEVTRRSQLRVDTRKWLMSKILPKKYGDKLELGGKIDSTINLTVVDFSKSDIAKKDKDKPQNAD